jgi:hypothetical protein
MAVTLPFAVTCQYDDSGVAMGLDPTTSTSFFIDLSSIDGLDNAPFRITSRAREGSDGGFMDAEFEDMRVITIEGTCYNCDANSLQALKANFAPSKVVKPYYVFLDGVGQRVVFCKSLGFRYKIDQSMRLATYQFQAQLQAEDPTIWSDPAITASSGLVGTYGGIGFNLGFNFGFGATTGTAGYAAAYNSGDKPGDATIVIAGPVINPTVVRDQDGSALAFSISLAAGDTLTLSLRNRTVLLNGTANRRSTLLGTSKWFLLQPGQNNILFLGTAGVGGTPNMSVTYRSAYR